MFKFFVVLKFQDIKFFGELEKCSEDNFVRCCGASESIRVGETTSALPELTTTDSYEITTFEIPITTTINQPESREIFLVYPEANTSEITTEIQTTETPTTTEISTTESMLILIPETVLEKQPQQRRKIRRRFKPQTKDEFVVTTSAPPELTSFTPKKDENREIRRNKVQQTYRRRTETKTTTIQPASIAFTKQKRPIFDASRRANFFSRTKPKSTPIEAEEVEEVVKILPPQVDSLLQEKVDQEHRTMIEHVRSALSSRSLKNNFEIAEQNMPKIQIKELEAMEKMIQNLLMDLVKEISNEKPNMKINRGRKKYSTTTTESTIKLANQPIKSKRRRMRITTNPTTTTPSSKIQEITTTKIPSKRRAYLAANRKRRVLNRSTTTTTTTEEPILETTTTQEVTEIPEIITETQKEIRNSPLIADFMPSPLWTLHSEADEKIIYQISGNRQSRDTFQTPINMESGFVPMIHAFNPLNIVGPVPSGFKSQFQDSLIFQLPEVNSFTVFKI